MNVVNIYKDDELVSLESYLEKNNVKDVEEYLRPTGKYIESYINYEDLTYICSEIKYWINVEDSKIFIIQDGDCDGVCSTTILYQYLKALREDWDISILIHESKQRGLDDEDIMKRIREESPDLVIIPDAGTNNKKQSEELCELNIGLVVLDHHDYQTPIEKGYLVNNQNKKYNVQRNGSGTLVVHKLLEALDNTFNVNWSSHFIDLVALSLVSDSMNMTEMENREYYYYGIEKIENINNSFLRLMFEKFIGDKEYSQRDISFKVIPKINSICRHKNMEYKERLILALISNDYEYQKEVLSIVEQAHKDQIEKVNSIIENNKEEIENINSKNNIIFFSSDDIPRSYSGLVCGKIMNMCDGKPTIVGSIKDDYFIGSLRSPIPLRSELDKNDLVDFANGHEDSCGIGIESKNIESLISYYNSVDLSYEPKVSVLQSYNFNEIPLDLFNQFYGYDNIWTNSGLPKPKFYIKNILFNAKNVNIIGKNKRTLKFTIDGIDVIIFNCLKEDKEKLFLGYYQNDKFIEETIDKKLKMDCICEFSINYWNGRATKQIIIDSYNVSEEKIITKKDLFKC